MSLRGAPKRTAREPVLNEGIHQADTEGFEATHIAGHDPAIFMRLTSSEPVVFAP